MLLAKHPDATDAYIALGIANYIIGSRSAGSRFVLRFDGIHGDKNIGMEQVARAAANGLYLRPFAKIILAVLRKNSMDDIDPSFECSAFCSLLPGVSLVGTAA